MNRIQGILLVTVMLLPGWVLSQALNGQADDQHYIVMINNTCHEDIRVAVHYRHPRQGWVTEGWWEAPANSEVTTDIVSAHNRFYMHGRTAGGRFWPPARSSKRYNRYPVASEANFLFPENALANDNPLIRFSLKEVSVGSPGLKARFEC